MEKFAAFIKSFLPQPAPFILLSTPRLSIRSLHRKDLDALYAMISMPETSKYDFYEPYTRKEALHKINTNSFVQPNFQKGHHTYAVSLNEQDQLVGTIGCDIYVSNHFKKQAQIGYTIHPHFQQMGYGYEACRVFVDQLFRKDIHRITASCFPENVASWKLLEKLGFRREAHHIKAYFTKGRYWDSYHYALLAEEWPGAFPNASLGD